MTKFSIHKIKYIVNSILIVLSIISWRCGSPHYITTKKISDDVALGYNFEIAEISVATFNNKYGFPVEYSKNDIIVCVISTKKFDNLDLIKSGYQNIDEYWTIQEKKDSINFDNFSKSYKARWTIYFQKDQKYVNWVRYPFNRDSLSSKSLIIFEKEKWYKLSHLDREYDLMGKIEIFIYIDKQGKLKRFYFVNGEYLYEPFRSWKTLKPHQFPLN
jgi:hypothetical protein